MLNLIREHWCQDEKNQQTFALAYQKNVFIYGNQLKYDEFCEKNRVNGAVNSMENLQSVNNIRTHEINQSIQIE